MILRWARQGRRYRVWRPWWLLGLLEVATYPRPARSYSARPGALLELWKLGVLA